MQPQKYIPVHLRNKSSSFKSNSYTFDEEFPDLLGSNSSLNTIASSQKTDPIVKYNEIYSREGESENSAQLPEGWVKLSLNNYKKTRDQELTIWEQRKMQDNYEKGLEFMEYIQDQNQEFIDTFIYQHGINEYLRLYKCELQEDSESDNESFEELSDLDSDEDYEY